MVAIWCGVRRALNKHSMLFFGFGLFPVGLLLTKQRRQFASPWIWLGGLIALLIFLPNLMMGNSSELSNGGIAAECAAERAEYRSRVR